MSDREFHSTILEGKYDFLHDSILADGSDIKVIGVMVSYWVWLYSLYQDIISRDVKDVVNNLNCKPYVESISQNLIAV